MKKKPLRFSLRSLFTLFAALFCFFFFILSFSFLAGGEPAVSGNITPQAKSSASSTHPSYPLEGLADSRMGTQWGTATGQVTDQWLQFDWDSPKNICGVVLHATGPWTQTIDFQVRSESDDSWNSVGKSGSAEEKTPTTTIFEIPTTPTKSLRFLFEGGAAYFEVEVFDNPEKMKEAVARYTKMTLMIAGDLRGNLMGTVSQQNGTNAVSGAEITVSGATPLGPWEQKTTTDKSGTFEIPFPFASTRTIEISAVKGNWVAKDQWDVKDISTQLTPKTLEIEKSRISLCGTWDFVLGPPKDFLKNPGENATKLDWSPIKVPAHWEMEGFSPVAVEFSREKAADSAGETNQQFAYAGMLGNLAYKAESYSGVYRRTFHVPNSWKGKRIKFLAEAIYSRAEILINGIRIGAHDGGFTPFERDMTDCVKWGQPNEIMVVVDARSKAADMDNASVFAYFELAGIWQPLEIFAVSPVYVSHLATKTDFDAEYKDATLSVEFDAVNDQQEPGKLEIRWKLFDPQGKEIPLAAPKSKVAFEKMERKTLLFESVVRSPKWWTAEDPQLYKLVAEISHSKGTTTLLEQPVGFREIEVKNRAVTINGKPIKIRGICRLDAHPLLGRALTPEWDKLDMEMIKDANFNLVRATIAPPHTASLEYSDRIGLYVENEGPTCWGRRANDLRYAPLYQGLMCEYLERDRNHPSIIDWSICNESDYAAVFQLAHRKMKSIDPTRIYSATFTDDKELDVLTFHHPINMERIKDSLGSEQPVFFDEVLGLFHGMFDLGLMLDLDPGFREYWATGIKEMMQTINAERNQFGAVQFAWSDDAFLVPGKGINHTHDDLAELRYAEKIYKLPKRGIVGEMVWGTVDGWRRPRPEYWLSKKLYSPVQIEEKPVAVPENGKPITVPVENWNQFVDLNQYVCRWELKGKKGVERGTARANAEPMQKGTLHIFAKNRVEPDDLLTLKFYDSKNRMLDAYILTFQPKEIPPFPNSGKPARIAEERGYLNGASAIRLLGPNVELAYNRQGGELFRAIAHREIIMNSGPKLHVLKTKAPLLEYPVGPFQKQGMVIGPEDTAGDSVWKLTGSEYKTEGNQAVLYWKGRYGKDFDGGFTIRMDDAGNVEFQYDFKYNGEELWVREIGLDFALPLDFDRIIWDRKADYSFYPDDHISRPTGTAVAHPGVPQTIPPGNRPYGWDDHVWGSNDFRSVKRNIYTASLVNKLGEGIQIFSDGTQHVRATVGVNDIHFKVLDFYGGSDWTYKGGFHYGPGRLIKPGDVLTGTVRLKLVGKELEK